MLLRPDPDPIRVSERFRLTLESTILELEAGRLASPARTRSPWPARPSASPLPAGNQPDEGGWPDGTRWPGERGSQMKQRDRVAMTAEEIAAFLAEFRKVQLATINQDGTPHLVAMYYVMLDGQITFWTYRSSQKARNLARDSRLT